MKIIMKQGAGKTNAIVGWIKSNPKERRIMIVINEREKNRIMIAYDLTYQQVETLHTVRENYHLPTRHRSKFMIDNLDMMLEQILGFSIVGFSATID